jgi:hypothetical protein
LNASSGVATFHILPTQERLVASRPFHILGQSTFNRQIQKDLELFEYVQDFAENVAQIEGFGVAALQQRTMVSKEYALAQKLLFS